MSDKDNEDGSYEVEELCVPSQTQSQDGGSHPEDVSDRLDLRMGRVLPPPVNPAGMANTGPKGVKADYEIAKRNRMGEMLRDNERHKREVRATALGKDTIHLMVRSFSHLPSPISLLCCRPSSAARGSSFFPSPPFASSSSILYQCNFLVKQLRLPLYFFSCLSSLFGSFLY